MSDVPKIVQDRLRTNAVVGAHPDADMLTAFAEQALSGIERDDMVRHLSRCADCREVVALSIPPMESVAEPQVAREGVLAAGRTMGGGMRGWFAWPNLRWVAMTAAVAVVVSVLALRPEKQHKSMVDAVNEQAEEKTATLADSDARATSPVPARKAPAATSQAKSRNLLPRNGRESEMIALQPRREQAGIAVGSVAGPIESRSGSFGRKDSFSFKADKAVPVPAAPGAGASAGLSASGPQQAIQATTETVEVTNAAVEPQPSQVVGGVMGRNVAPLSIEAAAPPVEKAKPAAKEETQLNAEVAENSTQNKLAAAYATSDTASALKTQRLKKSKDVAAQWSLAQGKLERSVDAGASWQIALQIEHPLLSFGWRGSDVWAGGQGGTLFHSNDGGTTWTMVQPSTKSDSLKSDIVAIEVHGPAEIVLSTSNNESWSTADAGKTWDKK